MTIKKLLCCLLFLIWASARAQAPLGQALQINTHFKSIAGSPTWLLVIRDMQSGQVIPYLFDIKNNENYWVAFTYGHSYRVTVSNLKFGIYANINNFCQLENGVLSGKSMLITLSGQLTPVRSTSRCHIITYTDFGLPIATSPS